MSEILKFYTKTCEPCKLLTKILATGNVAVTEIDASSSPDLVRHYGIRVVPTLVHIDSGKQLGGLKSIIEINEWIKTCEEA